MQYMPRQSTNKVPQECMSWNKLLCDSNGSQSGAIMHTNTLPYIMNTWQHLGAYLVFVPWGHSGIQKVEARDAGKHPTMHKIALRTKNYNTWLQIDTLTKFEKPCCRKVKSYLKETTYKFTTETYVGFQKAKLERGGAI